MRGLKSNIIGLTYELLFGFLFISFLFIITIVFMG